MSFRYYCVCGVVSDPFTTEAERDMMLGIHRPFCTKPAPAKNSEAGVAAAKRATTFGVRKRRVV